MPLTEEQIAELEAILERGCLGHDVDPRWAMPAATVCTCFEDFEERAVALIAELRASQAEARRLREAIEENTFHDVDEYTDACKPACWRCEIAATAPAPAREGT